MCNTTFSNAITNIQATEEGCWDAISAAINSPGNPIDRSYVDQEVVGNHIAQLCSLRGVPHATPILQVCLYLEWRGRLLTQETEVWNDYGCASLSMPCIEIDGRLLDEDDFNYGEFSDLGREVCRTYPTCVAADGDVVSLDDIRASNRVHAFPISKDVLTELQADHAFPMGKIDYRAWAQQMRQHLDQVVSIGRKYVGTTELPGACTKGQHGALSVGDQVCRLASLMLDRSTLIYPLSMCCSTS